MSRSEKRLMGIFRSALIEESPVESVGVWHSAQPVLWKRARPLLMDEAPPGIVEEGVGGASNRMKKANFAMSVSASAAVVPSGFVVSFGVRANWHPGASSRSCG